MGGKLSDVIDVIDVTRVMGRRTTGVGVRGGTGTVYLGVDVLFAK